MITKRYPIMLNKQLLQHLDDNITLTIKHMYVAFIASIIVFINLETYQLKNLVHIIFKSFGCIEFEDCFYFFIQETRV